jgi:hypothetical protein
MRTTGKARQLYALELVGERLTGRAQPHPVTDAMLRGTLLEPAARAWYEVASGNAVGQAGFVLSDCGRWGCSPDGVTTLGGVEIKCPGRVALLAQLAAHEPADDYRMQIQGCMCVLGRKSWDFCLYSDEAGMPCAWWRIPADPVIQEALARELPVFCDEVEALESRIREEA